jgi:hypothetical protein
MKVEVGKRCASTPPGDVRRFTTNDVKVDGGERLRHCDDNVDATPFVQVTNVANLERAGSTVPWIDMLFVTRRHFSRCTREYDHLAGVEPRKISEERSTHPA